MPIAQVPNDIALSIHEKHFRNCHHDNREIRHKINSIGAKIYYSQCLQCGEQGNAIAKSTIDSITMERCVPVDDQIGKTLQKARLDAYNREIEALQRVYQQELDHRYARYLNSPEWQEKRKRVFIRSHGWCEGCGIKQAEEVHHRNYDHLFDEYLFELLALCRKCHEKIHGREDSHDDEIPF